MFEAHSHHRDPIEAKLQSKPSPGLGHIPSPAGRRCRAAADEGGQRLGQYHPSPGLRIGSCEVGPDSPIGRQPFISLFFLLPARRVTGGKTTSTIRMSPFLPQSRPNACPQRHETGSPETTSKTLSIATSHQPKARPTGRRSGAGWSGLLPEIILDHCLELPVDLKAQRAALLDGFRGGPAMSPRLLDEHQGHGAAALATVDQHLAARAGETIDEIANPGHTRIGQRCPAHPIVEILHAQGAHLIALGPGAQRLLGLAVVAQIDHACVALVLALQQVLLGGLVADDDLRGDWLFHVHRMFPHWYYAWTLKTISRWR